jgi:hypothetical protein
MAMLSRDQIAALRREIEAIQELNAIYRARKDHSFRDRTDNERRQIRLEEIKQKLLDCTRVTPGHEAT